MFGAATQLPGGRLPTAALSNHKQRPTSSVLERGQLSTQREYPSSTAARQGDPLTMGTQVTSVP